MKLNHKHFFNLPAVSLVGTLIFPGYVHAEDLTPLEDPTQIEVIQTPNTQPDQPPMVKLKPAPTPTRLPSQNSLSNSPETGNNGDNTYNPNQPQYQGQEGAGNNGASLLQGLSNAQPGWSIGAGYNQNGGIFSGVVWRSGAGEQRKTGEMQRKQIEAGIISDNTRLKIDDLRSQIENNEKMINQIKAMCGEGKSQLLSQADCDKLRMQLAKSTLELMTRNVPATQGSILIKTNNGSLIR